MLNELQLALFLKSDRLRELGQERRLRRMEVSGLLHTHTCLHASQLQEKLRSVLEADQSACA